VQIHPLRSGDLGAAGDLGQTSLTYRGQAGPDYEIKTPFCRPRRSSTLLGLIGIDGESRCRFGISWRATRPKLHHRTHVLSGVVSHRRGVRCPVVFSPAWILIYVFYYLLRLGPAGRRSDGLWTSSSRPARRT